jgi:hypothetical protein
MSATDVSAPAVPFEAELLPDRNDPGAEEEKVHRVEHPPGAARRARRARQSTSKMDFR